MTAPSDETLVLYGLYGLGLGFMMGGYSDLARMNNSISVYISPLRGAIDLVLIVLSSLGFIGCFIYGFFIFPWWVPLVFGIS